MALGPNCALRSSVRSLSLCFTAPRLTGRLASPGRQSAPCPHRREFVVDLGRWRQNRRAGPRSVRGSRIGRCVASPVGGRPSRYRSGAFDDSTAEAFRQVVEGPQLTRLHCFGMLTGRHAVRLLGGDDRTARHEGPYRLAAKARGSNVVQLGPPDVVDSTTCKPNARRCGRLAR